MEFYQTRSFYKIKDEWAELYRNNKTLSYYQSFEYTEILWRNIFTYSLLLRVRPLFFVFKNNGTTMMILPLFKKIFKNEYMLFGKKAGVGYLDAIYSDSVTTTDLDDCFAILEKTVRGKIIFDHVRSETLLGKWLLMKHGKVSQEGCSEIEICGNYNEYYSSLSKHMRQNIRTAYNRLKSDGCTLEYSIIDYNNMEQSLYKQLQKLYIERQILKYNKNPLYRYFVKYIDLGTKIQKQDSIKEKALLLFINGNVAAFCDAIYTENRIIVPRLAIGEGYDRYSPGVILLNESIKKLIDEDIKWIDLTHGTEAYKVSMGGKIHYCVEAEIEL